MASLRYGLSDLLVVTAWLSISLGTLMFGIRNNSDLAGFLGSFMMSMATCATIGLLVDGRRGLQVGAAVGAGLFLVVTTFLLPDVQ